MKSLDKALDTSYRHANVTMGHVVEAMTAIKANKTVARIPSITYPRSTGRPAAAPPAAAAAPPAAAAAPPAQAAAAQAAAAQAAAAQAAAARPAAALPAATQVAATSRRPLPTTSGEESQMTQKLQHLKGLAIRGLITSKQHEDAQALLLKQYLAQA